MSAEPNASSTASVVAPSSATKKSKAKPAAKPAAELSFTIGDIVLARLRGFPPWPARIADPETVPRNVAKQRPGKNPSIYCCQFFPAGDFSWLQAKEIKPLTSDDITKFLAQPHRKTTGPLRTAYSTAQDPTEWDAKQEEIHRAQEEEEANVDELEDEDEAEVKGGKRKRGAAPEKKKAKAKVAEPEESKAKKVKAAPAPKAAAEKKKQPASKADADDADPLSKDPECSKVKDWRHRLQKAFLGGSMPSEDEMKQHDELFKTIEAYEGMSIEALTYSKIGKVMKKMVTLPAIPKNDEYKITERASKLMRQWSEFIASSTNDAAAAASTPAATTAPAPAAAAEPATNGETEKPAAAPVENQTPVTEEKPAAAEPAAAEPAKPETETAPAPVPATEPEAAKEEPKVAEEAKPEEPAVEKEAGANGDAEKIEVDA
ncbi:hypothetical protein IAT38_006638 [Cryptococcus sp. DSM 104549]